MNTAAVRLGLGAALGAVVLAAGVVALGDAAAPAGRAPAPLARHPLDRLALVRGGIATPLGRGEAVPLAGETSATIEILAGDGVRYARVLHLRLVSGDAPVDDASVVVAAHMLTMDHGSFTAVALLSGGGTYVADLPFAMPGEWQLEVHVLSRGVPADVTLGFEEFD